MKPVGAAALRAVLILMTLIAARPGPAGPSVPEVLRKDPVFYGAWLYRNHCVRCHGAYGEQRIGGGYDRAKDLKQAIEDQGCEISWARRFGGDLSNTEIRSIVRFIRKYEALDGPPDLPDLPPPPKANVPAPEPLATDKPVADGQPAIAASPQAIDPAVRALIQTHRVAQGAYLYTRNCYRCHLSYEKARMGMGLAVQTVERTIFNGKTSTQMKPFSRTLGGDLTNKEIKAITEYIAAWERFGESPAVYPALLIPPKTDPNQLLPIGLPVFPRIAGNPVRGRELFVNHCIRCHGMQGEGYLAPSLQKTWWTLRPDLLVKSTLKQGVPGSGMPAWSQNSGGALTARDIEDVVSHVVALGN